MENQICKPHTQCRVCGSKKLTMYLDLGQIPLANNLENTKEKAINAPRYPLEIMLCEDCGLSQLSTVIDPEKLFAYYTYRSSVNGGYVKHCRQMAEKLKEKYNLNEDSFIIDIAGNDGTLLKEFRAEIGCDVLNIDPAENLTTICKNDGIPAWSVFWNYEVAKALRGQADVITATNVFAHVDNIKEFLEAVKLALKPNGICVIECPYIVDHIKKMEWTQTYFEHLSYMSVGPIHILCNGIGLKMISVEHQEIHGGTIRMIIAHKDSVYETDDTPEWYFDFEMDAHYDSITVCKEWSEKVKKSIYSLSMDIGILKIKGNKIAAFAASAKGNTLLNAALLDYNTIDYIVDETPEKIGKYSPGTGIPIMSVYSLISTPPDYLIILSWNFAEEIVQKCRNLGYKGKFILPVPQFKITDSWN